MNRILLIISILILVGGIRCSANKINFFSQAIIKGRIVAISTSHNQLGILLNSLYEDIKENTTLEILEDRQTVGYIRVSSIDIIEKKTLIFGDYQPLRNKKDKELMLTIKSSDYLYLRRLRENNIKNY